MYNENTTAHMLERDAKTLVVNTHVELHRYRLTIIFVPGLEYQNFNDFLKICYDSITKIAEETVPH